jgi:hypothetical protein
MRGGVTNGAIDMAEHHLSDTFLPKVAPQSARSFHKHTAPLACPTTSAHARCDIRNALSFLAVHH